MSKKFSERWKEEKEAKKALKEKKQMAQEPKKQQTLNDALEKDQFHIDTTKFKDRHLFVATPAYGGLVGEAYLKSMVKFGIICSRYGIQFTLATIANESLITRGRNTLVSMFMQEPKYTEMVFVDADIHFVAEDLLKLWYRAIDNETVQVVTGAYPKKTINWKTIRQEVVSHNLPEEKMEKYQASYVLNIRADEEGRIPMRNGLLPIYDAGTGFMLFKRDVIQTMMDKWPELHYKNDLGTDPKYDPYMYALFDTIIDPKTRRYLSEDYTFCRRWQELGGSIWLDPSINLDHQGTHLFRGNISNQFTVQKQITDQKADEMLEKTNKLIDESK